MRARRVAVSSVRTYEFGSAVESRVVALPKVMAPDAEVLWKIGSTMLHRFLIDGRALVSVDERRATINGADLVIADAVIGSAPVIPKTLVADGL